MNKKKDFLLIRQKNTKKKLFSFPSNSLFSLYFQLSALSVSSSAMSPAFSHLLDPENCSIHFIESRKMFFSTRSHAFSNFLIIHSLYFLALPHSRYVSHRRRRNLKISRKIRMEKAKDEKTPPCPTLTPIANSSSSKWKHAICRPYSAIFQSTTNFFFSLQILSSSMNPLSPVCVFVGSLRAACRWNASSQVNELLDNHPDFQLVT